MSDKEKLFDMLRDRLQECDIDAEDVICSKIVLDDYECTVAPSGRLFHDECKERCEAIAGLLMIIRDWKEKK